jgi:hypothetical protein
MSGMKRRAFISLPGGAAAAWPLAAGAQQGEQMRRIGVLIAGLTENDSSTAFSYLSASLLPGVSDSTVESNPSQSGPASFSMPAK